MVKFGDALRGRATVATFLCLFPEVSEGETKKLKQADPSRKTRFCNIAGVAKACFSSLRSKWQAHIVSNENTEAWTGAHQNWTHCVWLNWRPVKLNKDVRLSRDVSGWAETSGWSEGVLAEQRRVRLNRDVSGWTETKPDTPRLLPANRGGGTKEPSGAAYSLFKPYAMQIMPVNACGSTLTTFIVKLNSQLQ